MKNRKSMYSAYAMLSLIFVVITLILCGVNECHAQDKAVLKNDTLYYGGYKFYSGQLLKLSYGSTSDKDFAFAYVGSGIGGFQKAGSKYAKSTLLIDQVLMDNRSGLSSVKGELVGVGLRMVVSIEGAVDNKEIQ